MKMDTRPSKTTTFLAIALTLSRQATCARRKVGVVMTDIHHDIIASGYNGNARGTVHCIDSNCKGHGMSCGQGLDVCEAIHAEQNALMKCKNVNDIVNVFCTTAPCAHCIKMLMNTGAINIYYMFDYHGIEDSKTLWLLSDKARTITKIDYSKIANELNSICSQ